MDWVPNRGLRGPWRPFVQHLKLELEIHPCHHLALRLNHVLVQRSAVLRHGIGLDRKTRSLLHIIRIRLCL
jgi:hypothetical protein